MNKKINLFKTSGIVLILIILGKIFSLIREMYFSTLFGTTAYADAYFTASIIPSLLNTPLTISSLVFFVPLYTKCREEKGDAEANKFASNLLTTYVIFNTVLTVIAYVASPLMIKVIAAGYDATTYEYAVRLSRLLVLSFPATIAVYVLMNLSNAKQKHYAPQLLTLFNSIISIVLMYFFVPKYGIYAVPLIGLAAWIFQLFFQSFCLRKEYRYRFTVDLKDPTLKVMIVLAIPTIIATAAEQINLSVDNFLCTSLEAGTVSVLNYAQKLFNLLNGTIATAIITVAYPVFSKLYAAKKRDSLTENVNKYFAVILLILLPITILCIVLSSDIVAIVFGRGAFDGSSVERVSEVFRIYVLAAVFTAIKELVTRIFYVFEESRMPMLVNVLGIVTNIIGSCILVRFIGVLGIVIATVFATMVSCVVEILMFRRKFSGEYYRNIFMCSEFFKYVVATIAMAVAAIGTAYLLKDTVSVVRLFGTGIAAILVYLGILLLQKESLCMAFWKKVHQGNGRKL